VDIIDGRFAQGRLLQQPPEPGVYISGRDVAKRATLGAALRYTLKGSNTMAAKPTSGSVVSHVWSALLRAAGRIVLWFGIGFVVAAILVEVIALIFGGGHVGALTHVAAAALGLAFGYAAGLTVLVGEVISFLVKSVQEIERSVQGDLTSGSRIVEGFVENIEKRL